MKRFREKLVTDIMTYGRADKHEFIGTALPTIK